MSAPMIIAHRVRDERRPGIAEAARRLMRANPKMSSRRALETAKQQYVNAEMLPAMPGKTAIIHIVGAQGVGKSHMAGLMLADLQARGKSAVLLNKCGWIHDTTVDRRNLALWRSGLTYRAPYQSKLERFSFLIVEHDQHPPPCFVAHGEMVLLIGRQA